MQKQRTITIPYNYVPRDYQEEFLMAPQKFKVAIFHRRGGKSKTVFNEQVRKTQLPELAGKTFYYVMPTFSQCKKVVWDEMVKEHVPMEIVKKMNASELAIYYKNGSIQRFVGTDDYRNLKGINPIDVVFDEYQNVDPRAWLEVVKPILSQNGGTVTFIGTPQGHNQLWDILQYAKQNPNSWFCSVKTVDDTNAITEKALEIDKGIMPESLFLQEFYCSFSEGAGSFFKNIQSCLYEADDYPNPKHFFNLGADLAKYNDFTVLTPFDLCTFEVKKQERFNQVDWNFQKLLIESTARRYNNAKLKIDRTGVGDPVVEDLERRGLNIGDDGAIVFSTRSRRDLLDNLSILIQQNKIKIPNDPELITELEAFQFVLNEHGKIEVKGRKSVHDDRVMSLALAVHGVTSPVYNNFGDTLNDEIENKSFNKFSVI